MHYVFLLALMSVFSTTACSGEALASVAPIRSITDFVSFKKTPKPQKQRRYIFTGAPATGKTVTINALRAKGHVGFDEPATRVIHQRKHVDGIQEPWLESDFDARILQCIAHDHASLKSIVEEIVFFDRSAIDALIYAIKRLEEGQVITDRALLTAVEHAIEFYHPIVFSFEPFGCSEDNGIRYEQSQDERDYLDKALAEGYAALGFKVVRVPVASIEERVAFIIAEIEKHKLEDNP